MALEVRQRLSKSPFTVDWVSQRWDMVTYWALSRWASSRSSLEVNILSLSRAGCQGGDLCYSGGGEVAAGDGWESWFSAVTLCPSMGHSHFVRCIAIDNHTKNTENNDGLKKTQNRVHVHLHSHIPS